MDSKYQTPEDIFECQQCGECCTGFGGTYVTEKDVVSIARFIQTDPDTFLRDYCDMAGSRPVLTQGKDSRCIFFDTQGQCTIHPVKPYMCRAWPFIQTIIKNPENWNAMAGSCPGMKKDIPFQDLIRIVAKEKARLDQAAGR